MKTNTVLFGDVLKIALQPWLDELGKSDADRLQAVARLSADENIRLSVCLHTVFPNAKDEQKALADFTKFRKRVNDVSAEIHLGFALHVDTKKKNPPSDRCCWFTGPDGVVQRVESYSQQVTADVAGRTFEPPRGLPTTGSAMASGKRMVRFFVSYAHDNQVLADGLVKGLKTEFGASRRYAFEPWTDHLILVGKDWHASIQKAIESCDFGLLLVSPAFLGSSYIGQYELSKFVGRAADKSVKPVVPVCLTTIDLDRQDLKGLEKAQIFFYRSERTAERCYDQMRGSSQQRAFAHALFVAIEKRLDDYFQPRPQVAACVADAMTGEDVESCLPAPELVKHFQRTKGRGFTLRQLEQLDSRTGQQPDQSRDALTEIAEWACKPDASPFFALLGEYGIGKTTTLKHLTRALLDKRKDDIRVPLPIYVDLRDYMGEPNAVPTLDDLLDAVIKRAWKLKDRTVTAKDILRLVREEGALMIFDGLDEKIVHLTPSRAREFIRTLWSILPDANQKDAKAQPGQRRGKLLISCRSHYFRDVGSQNAMLTGESREGIDASDYPAFCLLPFTENQIRDYLTAFLGNAERGKAAFELIASIHNLRDLAERPVLLQLIGDRLGDLEAVQAAGETVNAARLYDLVVKAWLNRDDGKHTIDPMHKRRLMEELSAALWRSGEKQWEADRLEEWLDTFLFENPAIAGAYANKERALLKEDLRTATFVLRPDTDEKNFRFAHTSLQEYFLACYLARALKERKPERWNLPKVSDETLDFFGQILSLDKDARARQTLDAILGGSCLPAATIAFRYWLEAIKLGYPEPKPSRVNLEGLDAEEWAIRGHGSERLLNLRGANLKGAKLNRCRLEWVDLSEANMNGVQARQALFLHVFGVRIKLNGADLAGLKWRIGSLGGADLRDTILTGVQLVQVSLKEAVFQQEQMRLASSVDFRHTVFPFAEKKQTVVTPVRGHVSSVVTCAWNPDGRHVLSCGDDGTLRVWDIETGECVQVLEGHLRSVGACAWSPDGRKVLSGSEDRSLRVWDAETGKCLRTIEWLGDAVRACAWSPNGKHILSGAWDCSLRMWDVETGGCLRVFEPHKEPISVCAWSPDGRYVLSGSWDNCIRIWSVANGKCTRVFERQKAETISCAWSPNGQQIAIGLEGGALLVCDVASGICTQAFAGHDSSINSCAWSPDGRQIVSGGDDHVLLVWDVETSERVRVLNGHSSSVCFCAWSPDGHHILSCADEGSLRVWDADKGECVRVLEGCIDSVNICAWSSDRQHMLTGEENGMVRMWSTITGKCLRIFDGHSKFVFACAWSPDGHYAVSGGWDNLLRVWDITSGKCLLILDGHKDGVQTCSWSSDGLRILSGSLDRSLRIWNAKTGRCLATIEGHEQPISMCAWSPKGLQIISSDWKGALWIWNADTGQRIKMFRGHTGSVRACAWRQDGRQVLSGADDCTLRTWDVETGECLRVFEKHGGYVSTCAWSPDGRYVLSGAWDNKLRIWNVETGKCVQTFEGHSAAVSACAWDLDGRHIFSSAWDLTLRVWNVKTGKCLRSSYIFPERQSATLDFANNRILSASPEAWRWLGWRWKDPETGRMRILPAEYFGPLPEGKGENAQR